MPDPNPAVLDYLLTRRSRPAKTLTTPVPTAEELTPILTAGLRVPDHGKLPLGAMRKRSPRGAGNMTWAIWPWW